MKFGT